MPHHVWLNALKAGENQHGQIVIEILPIRHDRGESRCVVECEHCGATHVCGVTDFITCRCPLCQGEEKKPDDRA